MKNKIKFPLLIGIIIIIVIVSIVLMRGQDSMSSSIMLGVEQKPHILTVVVEGSSMLPMIAPGTLLQYDSEYFVSSKKHSSGAVLNTTQGITPKKGDIIIYEHSSNPNYLIKKVMVTDSDTVEFGKEDHTLLVNGEVMKNSQGTPYIFTQSEIKMLSLYVHEKKIPKGTYFIFGDNTSESHDSRKFGAVAPQDFRGKVIQ